MAAECRRGRPGRRKAGKPMAVAEKVFGKRIKQLRKQHRLTQSELGEMVGLTQQSITAWETGRTYPNLETAAALADIFDISLDYLAMGTKSKTLTLQDLSEDQIQLLTELVALLRKHNHASSPPAPVPTPEEQDVLFRLISQFMK